MSLASESDVKEFINKVVSPKNQVIFAKIMQCRTPVVQKVLSALTKGEIALSKIASLQVVDENSLTDLVESSKDYLRVINFSDTDTTASDVISTLETDLLLSDMLVEYNLNLNDAEVFDVNLLTFVANINRYSDNGLTTFTDEDLFRIEFRQCVDDVLSDLPISLTALEGMFPTKATDILNEFPNTASDMKAQSMFYNIYSSIFVESKLIEAIFDPNVTITEYFVSYRETRAKLLASWSQLHIVNYTNPSTNFDSIFKLLSLEFTKDQSFSSERANSYRDRMLNVDFSNLTSEKLTMLRANTLISKGMKTALSLPTNTEDDFIDSLNILNNKITTMGLILKSISQRVRQELSVL